MKLPRIAHTIVIGCAVLLASISPQPVWASISSCAATVDMDSVPAETTNSFSFTVTNNTDNAEGASWIKLTVPSGDFTMAGSPSSPGWSNSNDTSSMTITGGSVDAGESYTFSIQVTSANVSAGAANWGIQLSTDAEGTDATSCSGSLGTAITGGGGDSRSPGISDLTVTDIGATSARITWTTDEAATSVLQYGTTGDYGVTKTDTTLKTSHSISFDGLAANTTYHYSVQSTDAANNTGDTGENTFVTNAASSTSTTSTTGTVRTVIVSASPSPTPIPDRTGPSVIISTKFEKTYTTPPEIRGTARDASAVVSVEYSLDGGINYLPVEEANTYGKTSVTFTVVPFQTDDGNYSLVFRSTDGKGNVSTYKSSTYVIDRLPPQFGATVVTYGSQVIEPYGDAYDLVTNLEYQLTSSVIGGAVSMRYSVENQNGEVADIPAQKNTDTGLWKATILLESPGKYSVYGTAIDGAQNKTVTELLQAFVVKSGRITQDISTPVERATVEVFVKNSSTNSFVSWDGKSYGQQNPIHTDKTGTYAFVLPSGTYYLRVNAFGYKSVISDIVTFDRMTALTQDITLSRAFGLRIGTWIIPLFDFSQTTVLLTAAKNANSEGNSNTKKTLIGTDMPFFRFPFDGKLLSSLDLRGKPTVITLLNTWSPLTSSQLPVLDSISKDSDIHTLIIVPHESAASVSTFMKRGSYTVRMIADPDGSLIEPLLYKSSPTHIFVNRKGTITGVIQGLATKEKMMDTSKE